MIWSKSINVYEKPRSTVAGVPSWWIDKMDIEPGDDNLTMFIDDATGYLVICPTEIFNSGNSKNDLVRDGAGDVHKKSLHAGNCPSVEADCENTQPGSKVKENMRG